MEAVTDRINLTYINHRKVETELPLKILVLSDFTADERSASYEADNGRILHGKLNDMMASYKIRFFAEVSNHLQPESGSSITIDYNINSIESFLPERIANDIPILKSACDLHRMLIAEKYKSRELSFLLDYFSYKSKDLTSSEYLMIRSDIEQRIQTQLSEIIQHPSFRKLERSWLSIDFLKERTPENENIEIALLNCTKQSIIEDFEDAPDISRTTIYDVVYKKEYGQLGGTPYTFIIADFDINEKSVDITLLRNLAAVCSAAHCTLLCSASPSLFGIKKFSDVPSISDMASHFDQPAYAKWNAFREHPDSRYVAMTLPDFLLRSRYRKSGSMLNYNEESRETPPGVWARSSYALASILIRSFARHRWFVNVTGDSNGSVESLTIASSENGMRKIIPTEVMLSDRLRSDLINSGFTPISIHKKDGCAVFTSIPSCMKSNVTAISTSADDILSRKLDSQLPFVLIVCRISHYLKVLQRENIGSWQTRSLIEKSMNDWMRQYISDMDNPVPAVRAKRPLRRANVSVQESDGKSGWFNISITITPHFRYMGNSFTLNEEGRLDKS